MANPYASQARRNTTGYSPVAPKRPAAFKPTPYPELPAANTGVAGPGPNPGADYTGPPSAPSSAAPMAIFDYTTDPILQQIQQLAIQSRADAETNALAAKKQLAIQYGDTALADQIGDTNTRQAAEQNPYSVYGTLSKNQGRDTAGLDENLNKNNLYYSGARIVQQHDLADQYGQQRALAAGAEQTALGGIEQNRLSAYLAAHQNELQAHSDAYNRALQWALTNQPSTGPGVAGVDYGNPLGTGAGGDYSPVAAGFQPPADGPDAGYIPAGTAGTILGQPVLVAPGGGVYRSGGGTVSYTSGKGRYGGKPLY